MEHAILRGMAEARDAAGRVRERMRQWMDVSGLTQEAFAEQFGRTKEWLQKILSATNDVRLADIDKIAEAMHLTPSELVRDETAGRYQMELTPTEVKLIQRVRHKPKALQALEELLQLTPSSGITKPSANHKSDMRSRSSERERP